MAPGEHEFDTPVLENRLHLPGLAIIQEGIPFREIIRSAVLGDILAPDYLITVLGSSLSPCPTECFSIPYSSSQHLSQKLGV